MSRKQTIKAKNCNSINYLLLAMSLFVAALSTYLLILFSDYPREIAFMTGIFLVAALLWVTEAIPLFATAILIIGLEVLLLGNPGGWKGLGMETAAGVNYTQYLSPLADPILVLFFGGFVLALAAGKTAVDRLVAGRIIQLFGLNARMLLLGFIIITAVFSMWMSNTATAAMMIALAVPVLEQLSNEPKFSKGLLLAIPFAANLGGLGTPIASPPNAVALAYLFNEGYSLDFFSWLLMAAPYMVVMLLMLWLTDRFHGLPAGVVALFPVIIFTMAGIIDHKDINKLDWHILLLIAGGLALGLGLQTTGLDKILLGFLPVESDFILYGMLAVTLLMSTFISNTASANLIIPLGIALAVANPKLGIIPLSMGIAFMASCAMALPVSTPPNAIAYARGTVKTNDFVLPGVIIGIVGFGLYVLYKPLLLMILEW